MKITVIGTGYVGLIAGLCFADFGNDVICLDVDKAKIDMLSNGQMPIYEVGAEDLIERNIKAKRISFTTDEKYAIESSEIIIIAVGTPETDYGDADLTYIYNVAEEIGKLANGYKVVVDKSTVPVGTSRRVYSIINNEIKKRGLDFKVDVASNPEFLREGKAIGDFLNPDRIIIGSDSEIAKEKLISLYKVFNRSSKPIMLTTPETAEIIKYASNAFLATKIAFINEMSQLCEAVGANVLEVAKAMGQDGRISPKFLHPGPGYGGSCFPKDTKAIVRTGKEYGVNLSIIDSVIKSNETQKRYCAEKIMNNLSSGTIAVLGVAFKPDTDDVRESPALEIIEELLNSGNYKLNIYDPKAMEEARKRLHKSDNLNWCDDLYSTLKGADAIAIITEWLEFRNIDLDRAKSLMNGNLFFDFRNIYSIKEIEENGFNYFGTGVSK
jgi:UDPglucose 6-dehydrogenase